MRSTCDSSFVPMILRGASRVHIISRLFLTPIFWKDHLLQLFGLSRLEPISPVAKLRLWRMLVFNCPRESTSYQVDYLAIQFYLWISLFFKCQKALTNTLELGSLNRYNGPIVALLQNSCSTSTLQRLCRHPFRRSPYYLNPDSVTLSPCNPNLVLQSVCTNLL